MGSSLERLKQPEKAIEAYHKALELHPNYPRVWVNLGVTYQDMGDYKKSAQCFLSALSLNPKAVHLWRYLKTMFNAENKPDLASLAEKKDINLFRDKFYIVSRENLPTPAKTITK